jgi:hypothetical protein
VCELKCENPHCSEEIECCPCSGQAEIIMNEGLFKAEEPDPRCCECSPA